MDPYISTFGEKSSTVPNGLPPESKLLTYLNSRQLSSGSPNPTCPSISKSLAGLSLQPSKKGNTANPTLSEYSSTSPVNPNPNNSLTHSASTPSFLPHYSLSSTIQPNTFQGSRGVNYSSTIASGLSDPTSQIESSTPKTSPQVTPHHSPTLQRSPSDPGINQDGLGHTSPAVRPTFQENVGGTTYYYTTMEEGGGGMDSQATHMTSSVVLPNFHVYPSTPSYISNMKPKANIPSFFMPDELRLEILHRHQLSMAQVDLDQHPDLPSGVDNFHELCPLEAHPAGPGQTEKSLIFGYITSVYKCTNIKTGERYCLRRVHGYRLTNTKCMVVVDMWKKLQHSGIAQLREVFTTKSFGDHSLVFIYDYFPGAETLSAKHFSPALGGSDYLREHFNESNPSPGSAKPFSQQNKSTGPRQHAGLLPESLIWNYVIQLTSALRTVHAAGLACRSLDSSKILVTGKSRLRVNCCGLFDVLGYDGSQSNPMALIPHYQQDDLLGLGKLVLALACNSLQAVQRENVQTSVEIISKNYSSDLRNLILYLLCNNSRGRSINDIMPMIGARFYTQLDSALMRADVIEAELSKEVENGRLLRLLIRLGIINERPELNLDPAWSETGNRYMLKLFRDYLFHQVTEDGRPWLDMAHIIQCLNKLDVGSPDKICLMSHDEQNILVVTFAELKHCLQQSFTEITQAAAYKSGS